MKKIISILACVCLLLTAIIIPVSAADSVTYKLSDYSESGAVTNYSKALDETITIGLYNGPNTGSGYFHSAYLRIYAAADAQILSTKDIASVEIVMGDKEGSYTLSTSTDGSTWTTIVEGAAFTKKGTVTCTFDTPTKYIKITPTAQMRWDVLTVTFAAASGECAHEKTTTTSNGDETHSVVCDSCGKTVSTADCQDIDLDGACDTCTGTVALPETLTIAEAVALGTEQASNAYTADKYFVTGQITAIANTTYGNMYIADEEGNEIYVYGLYSADGSVRYDAMESKPDEGDTVKVLSTVGNYNGTAQLKNAWLIEFTAGELEPTTPDPEADTTLTIEEAIALGESKKSNVYTEGKYYVTGTVTEVYNETYGNMYIADENGNTLTIYGTYSADGSTGYADMETKPVAGDTITVYGIIGQYDGTAQMKNGWITEIASVEEETFEGTDPDAPIELAVAEGMPITPVEIKVPAGGTVFVKAADANGTLHVLSTTGSYMLINGMQNQLSAEDAADLTLCGYEMVNVYNPGEETITLYVFLEAGVAVDNTGTMDNPEVVTIAQSMWGGYGANVETQLDAGNQGYYYSVTAPEDGIITVGVNAMDDEYNYIGWFYYVNNVTSYKYGDSHWSDDEEPVYYEQWAVSEGDELVVFAATYDPNDMWNNPAGTVIVDFSFAPKGSYSYPFVLTETGDYATTVAQGSNGSYYEWVATADGTVTVTINDESGWQYNISKVPVDEEDYSNYYNSETHWYDDDPVVATETVDVVAGETIIVWVNTYDSTNMFTAPAGTVNWTLALAEKSEDIVVDAKFSIADAEAYIGKEFTVAIEISENPGIISAVLDIVYDKDVLELVKAEAGDFNNKTTSLEEEIDCYFFSEDFSRINWVDALAAENNTTNGTFAILTFKVKDDVAAGDTQISINFDADNIFNTDFDNVAFSTESATITIKDGIPGDVNGDGNVDNQDYALLMQHLNGWDVKIDLGVADVNGDGNVDNQDYALLMQFLNGWDVELK